MRGAVGRGIIPSRASERSLSLHRARSGSTWRACARPSSGSRPAMPARRSSMPPWPSPLSRREDGSGEAAFLLTRRADGLRAHGGQWALPGGRCDEGETVGAGGAARASRGDRPLARRRRRARHARRLSDALGLSRHAGGGVGGTAARAGRQPRGGGLGPPHRARRYRPRRRRRLRHHPAERAARRARPDRRQPGARADGGLRSTSSASCSPAAPPASPTSSSPCSPGAESASPSPRPRCHPGPCARDPSLGLRRCLRRAGSRRQAPG